MYAALGESPLWAGGGRIREGFLEEVVRARKLMWRRPPHLPVSCPPPQHPLPACKAPYSLEVTLQGSAGEGLLVSWPCLFANSLPFSLLAFGPWGLMHPLSPQDGIHPRDLCVYSLLPTWTLFLTLFWAYPQGFSSHVYTGGFLQVSLVVSFTDFIAFEIEFSGLNLPSPFSTRTSAAGGQAGGTGSCPLRD